MYADDIDTDSAGPFGNVTSYGTTLMQVSCNGWINHVAFSPSNTAICFISHDCELNFADIGEVGSKGKSHKPESVKLLHNGNPHLTCVFIAEEKLVACGYDKIPYLYEKQGGEWKMARILDDGHGKKRSTKITGNSFLDKKVYFNADFKLNTNVELRETDTKHVNYINCMKVFASDEGGKPLMLSTSDINGYLNFWDVS